MSHLELESFWHKSLEKIVEIWDIVYNCTPLFVIEYLFKKILVSSWQIMMNYDASQNLGWKREATETAVAADKVLELFNIHF